jgi:AcrR family transcriptional regulator
MIAAMSSPAPKTAYHHGRLREAMIEAAVEIVRESGAEAVTVREAARRAGVSSGAPFRHFANRMALMTGVAETGMTRLRSAVEQALAACEGDHPLRRMQAIGDAYIDWALAHPTHYRVLGDRLSIDWEGSQTLKADNRWIRERMLEIIDEARAHDLLRDLDINLLNLQIRGMAYGLVRMAVDGHLPEFGIEADEARGVLRNALAAFLASVARDQDEARRVLT